LDIAKAMPDFDLDQENKEISVFFAKFN